LHDNGKIKVNRGARGGMEECPTGGEGEGCMEQGRREKNTIGSAKENAMGSGGEGWKEEEE